MRVGLCRLCLQTRELCESHALPNSLFNYIFRNSDGKAIVVIDDATTPNQYSSDSWKTDLLCMECEDHLNKKYDSYGIAVFRGKIGSTVRGPEGVTFLSIDRQRLRMFFLSVLWRISVSSHESYSNIDLPHEWEEELRLALLAAKTLPRARYTVAVYRLHDSSPQGAVDMETLRSIIMAPVARQFPAFLSVCFIFFGFFIETFLPRLPKAHARQAGVLHGSSTVFVAPHQEILDLPEFLNVVVSGVKKHAAGLSKVS